MVPTTFLPVEQNTFSVFIKPKQSRWHPSLANGQPAVSPYYRTSLFSSTMIFLVSRYNLLHPNVQMLTLTSMPNISIIKEFLHKEFRCCTTWGVITGLFQLVKITQSLLKLGKIPSLFPLVFFLVHILASFDEMRLRRIYKNSSIQVDIPYLFNYLLSQFQ